MNILVTGSHGQLGSELQLLAPTVPHRFFFTDVEELDVCNPDAVEQFVQHHEIDVIINCAAYTAVDKAEGDATRAFLLNASAPRFLACAAQKRKALLVQVSTDYVFSGRASRPYREQAPTGPQSVYGKSKLQGEEAALKFNKRTLIVRTAWLYSSFGHNFVKTMLRLGREGKPLRVVFDQIGSPTYARDLACALLALIEQPVKPGVYHFTNEGVTSWYDFAQAIFHVAGMQCPMEPIRSAQYPTPAPRPAYSVLDKSKIKAAYGLHIPHWYDSLRECIQKIETSSHE